MFLMTEFERPERVQSVWESMTAQLMDYGLDWREAPGLRVFDHVLRGDYEAAIPSMLEMLSEPLAQDPKRPGLVIYADGPGRRPARGSRAPGRKRARVDRDARGRAGHARRSGLEMNRFHATGRGRAAPKIHRGR